MIEWIKRWFGPSEHLKALREFTKAAEALDGMSFEAANKLAGHVKLPGDFMPTKLSEYDIQFCACADAYKAALKAAKSAAIHGEPVYGAALHAYSIVYPAMVEALREVDHAMETYHKRRKEARQ